VEQRVRDDGLVVGDVVVGAGIQSSGRRSSPWRRASWRRRARLRSRSARARHGAGPRRSPGPASSRATAHAARAMGSEARPVLGGKPHPPTAAAPALGLHSSLACALAALQLLVVQGAGLVDGALPAALDAAVLAGEACGQATLVSAGPAQFREDDGDTLLTLLPALPATAGAAAVSCEPSGPLQAPGSGVLLPGRPERLHCPACWLSCCAPADHRPAFRWRSRPQVCACSLYPGVTRHLVPPPSWWRRSSVAVRAPWPLTGDLGGVVVPTTAIVPPLRGPPLPRRGCCGW
jgi:hypothetical protein